MFSGLKQTNINHPSIRIVSRITPTENQIDNFYKRNFPIIYVDSIDHVNSINNECVLILSGNNRNVLLNVDRDVLYSLMIIKYRMYSNNAFNLLFTTDEEVLMFVKIIQVVYSTNGYTIDPVEAVKLSTLIKRHDIDKFDFCISFRSYVSEHDYTPIIKLLTLSSDKDISNSLLSSLVSIFSSENLKSGFQCWNDDLIKRSFTIKDFWSTNLFYTGLLHIKFERRLQTSKIFYTKDTIGLIRSILFRFLALGTHDRSVLNLDQWVEIKDYNEFIEDLFKIPTMNWILGSLYGHLLKNLNRYRKIVTKWSDIFDYDGLMRKLEFASKIKHPNVDSLFLKKDTYISILLGYLVVRSDTDNLPITYTNINMKHGKIYIQRNRLGEILNKLITILTDTKEEVNCDLFKGLLKKLCKNMLVRKNTRNEIKKTKKLLINKFNESKGDWIIVQKR